MVGLLVPGTTRSVHGEKVPGTGWGHGSREAVPNILPG